MYRLSPRRNHRSKSFKVKHILQICLLLAVCFWLIYQVKRSHEKRKEFDAKDENLVGKVQTDGEIQRFGRKDLPRVTEIATNGEKNSEDEEEKEVEEEGNRLDEDEPETEDSRRKGKEEEDAGRGDGDDEIGENELEKIDHEDELEKSETKAKHKKEQVNEYSRRGGNEAATQENHAEDDDAEEEEHSESEDNKDTVNTNHTETEDDRKEDHDHDHDGRSTNTQETREEQYKADDASSEVAHNIQTTIPETENSTTGHANQLWGKVNFGQENKTKTTDQEDAGVHPQEDKTTNNGALSNITTEINSTKSVDSSHQNSTLPALPSNRSENSSNFSAVGAEHSAPLTSNGTQTTSDEKPISLGNVPEDEKQLSSAVGSNKTENVNTDAVESKISGNMTSASSQQMSNSDTMLVDDEKSENGSEEGGNVIQHDPIDASDVTLSQEEKESSTVMDTLPLPEIRNEVQNSVDTTTQ